jgi:hypothetical protein
MLTAHDLIGFEQCFLFLISTWWARRPAHGVAIRGVLAAGTWRACVTGFMGLIMINHAAYKTPVHDQSRTACG